LLSTGFFELFETLLSYLTNTLSFMRIGAYAITHVGLMMVIQMLAGSNLNPIVLILGNLFVMGFEGLLVGIQVLRLEFYELFGRFYDDSGEPYRPKIIDYSAKTLS
jgi:V/A-type H+-transporting ATPase subunit I